jgi:hypothetical protein
MNPIPQLRPTGRRLLLCAAIVVTTVGSSSVASASDTGDGSTATVTAEVSPDDAAIACAEVVAVDGEALEAIELIDIEGDAVAATEVSDAEASTGFDVESMNAEQDELAAYLDARGIAYEVITDGEYRYVEIDWDDPAAAGAVDDFYWEKYPMSQEDIDAINADTDALVAFLQERGLAVTVTTDAHGLRFAEYDWEDPAIAAAVDEFYWQLYPMSQEDIDAINAETDAFVAFLQERGIAVTVTTDAHGLTFAEFDWEDPAAMAAAEEFWSSMDGELVELAG